MRPATDPDTGKMRLPLLDAERKRLAAANDVADQIAWHLRGTELGDMARDVTVSLTAFLTADELKPAPKAPAKETKGEATQT